MAIRTYLGCLGIDLKRKTKQDFEVVKRRIDKKLAGWNACSLSTADKVVLIKSNLIGIPQYSMNGLNF